MSEEKGIFDPDTFMSTTTDQADETTYRPIPEGEYMAVISKIEGRTPKGNSILDIMWAIDDERVRAETGMDNPQVRQSLFLDITREGGLERGANKNVQLGKLRAALNQNNPGQAWAPGMMEGQVARISVKHRIDGEATYCDVKGVTAV